MTSAALRLLFSRKVEEHNQNFQTDNPFHQYPGHAVLPILQSAILRRQRKERCHGIRCHAIYPNLYQGNYWVLHPLLRCVFETYTSQEEHLLRLQVYPVQHHRSVRHRPCSTE